ncbi:MAG: hypothetical protein RQ729_04450 [Wenzhouxiangellaceae bacterium]|nr:hypothetical protein [Wenzhouxiangellaceae bacterium]
MSRAGRAHLAEQLRISQDLLARLAREADDYPRLAELQHWQRLRLRETYEDLRRQPDCAQACLFFLEELYGGLDMRARDQQLERALPVMSRMLPDHLLHAVGEAMRLQSISMDFDARLSRLIEGPLDQPAYAAGYRAMAAWDERAEQIDLIGELGELLISTVRVPLIRGLVRLMQRPAHAAGFGLLQEFLANGLDAFAAMGKKAKPFVATIVEREREALARMRAGEDWPFRPWIGDGPEL